MDHILRLAKLQRVIMEALFHSFDQSTAPALLSAEILPVPKTSAVK